MSAAWGLSSSIEKTSAELTASTTAIRDTVSELRKILQSDDVERQLTGLNAPVDHITWRAIQVILVLVVAAVLGALVGCGVLPLLGPTPVMKPLFENFASQPWPVKRDCLIAWATVAFTFTARPTLDIGLYRGAAFAAFIFVLEKCYAKAQEAADQADQKAEAEEGPGRGSGAAA